MIAKALGIIGGFLAIVLLAAGAFCLWVLSMKSWN